MPYKQFNLAGLNLPRDTGQYIIPGPVTMRKACKMILSNKKETPFNNFGGNRQNLEKGMRRIYKADSGMKLIQVDQSGADALIVAYLCRHGKLRELFIHGIKPHIYNALIIVPEIWKTKFRADYVEKALVTPIAELKHLDFWKDLAELIKSSDDWPAKERYYYFGKKVGHAFAYGMMGRRFQMVLLTESGGEIAISLDAANKFILAMSNTYNEILYWHAKLYEEAVSKKCIRNLFGWPLNITWHIDSNDMKDLYSWIPQSTVAGITTQAFVKFQEYIVQHDKNWHLLAETHDSYMAEAPESEVEECARKMKEFMEADLVAPDGTPFKMRSGVSVGKNWSNFKKDKNPDGLVEVNF